MRTIAIYTIADGTDSINARIEDAVEYVETELGAEFAHGEIRDVRRKHHDGHTRTQIESVGDRSELEIGIDMPPDDRREDAASPGTVADAIGNDDHLITVAPRDLPPTDTARKLLERGVSIHNTDTGIRLTDAKTGGLSPAAKRALEAITDDHDVGADEPVTGHVHQGGRPPLGCKVDGGMLRADDDYSTVRQTLFRFESGEMSRADAARRIGCVEKTIDNALERRELYRLDAIESAGV